MSTARPRSPSPTTTLFTHPSARIVHFTLPTSWSPPLPWRQLDERTLSSGPLHILTSASTPALLRCGSARKPLLPDTPIWQVDARGVFILREHPGSFWRIELSPSPSPAAAAAAFRTALAPLCAYEPPECPFVRAADCEPPRPAPPPDPPRVWSRRARAFVDVAEQRPVRRASTAPAVRPPVEPPDRGRSRVRRASHSVFRVGEGTARLLGGSREDSPGAEEGCAVESREESPEGARPALRVTEEVTRFLAGEFGGSRESSPSPCSTGTFPPLPLTPRLSLEELRAPRLPGVKAAPGLSPRSPLQFENALGILLRPPDGLH